MPIWIFWIILIYPTISLLIGDFEFMRTKIIYLTDPFFSQFSGGGAWTTLLRIQRSRRSTGQRRRTEALQRPWAAHLLFRFKHTHNHTFGHTTALIASVTIHYIINNTVNFSFLVHFFLVLVWINLGRFGHIFLGPVEI